VVKRDEIESWLRISAADDGHEAYRAATAPPCECCTSAAGTFFGCERRVGAWVLTVRFQNPGNFDEFLYQELVSLTLVAYSSTRCVVCVRALWKKVRQRPPLLLLLEVPQLRTALLLSPNHGDFHPSPPPVLLRLRTFVRAAKALYLPCLCASPSSFPSSAQTHAPINFFTQVVNLCLSSSLLQLRGQEVERCGLVELGYRC
jgi:hypothetical protein